MLLELLLDRVQPVVELLRLGVQPDEFGHQRGDVGVAQGVLRHASETGAARHARHQSAPSRSTASSWGIRPPQRAQGR